MTKTNHPV